MNYDQLAATFKELIDNAQSIVIVQADNPDADSLASSLALEDILGALGKDTAMYCSLDIPHYLRYFPGWDRVQKDLPATRDLVILVDCGFSSLLTNTFQRYGGDVFPSEKTILLDHHAESDHDIDAILDINDAESVATGQLLYELCTRAGLELSVDACGFISQSLLADTLGFTTEAMTGRPRPIEIMADLVRRGVSLAEWQERRLLTSKLSRELFEYRIQLLSRIEFLYDDSIALLTIPYEELKEHSIDYNPTIALDDTRMVDSVKIAIGFKQYVSGGRLVKISARIRASHGYPVAEKLASSFGDGGGHPYAAGFKIEGENLNFEEIKTKVIACANQLLAENT